jgi:hypothetical protein
MHKCLAASNDAGRSIWTYESSQQTAANSLCAQFHLDQNGETARVELVK